ncbi:MAG: arylsulfatase [Chitinophagaceae bacterium]
MIQKKNILIFVLFLISGSWAFKPEHTKQFTLVVQGKPNKPNIIFILADDLGYGDLGCYGQQKIKTPNLDKMAKAGMRFTQFYAGSTVCAPSRASLMTGKHTGHNLIRGNGEVPLRQTDTILPQLLKKQGYVTGMVGKWGLGLKGTSGEPERKGWDYFTGYLHHREGHFQQADSVWKLMNGVSRKMPVSKTDYVNEIFAKSALDFIDQNKKNPFYLYVAFTLPHAELKVQDRYLRQYQQPDGQSVFTPETAHPAGQHYGPQPFPKAAYAAMVTSVDDYVSWILRKLAESGLEENTIVFFSSDNGTHVEGGRTLKDATEFFRSSGALRGVKRDLYEGGIRVPFLAYWKNTIKPNTTSTYVGAFWDIMPTLSALAGGQSPAGTDGISFVPALLSQKNQPKHESLYWEFYEQGFKQAVRKSEWKAIRFYKNGQPERTELYDLKKDLREEQNLAASMPGRVKALEAIMDKEHIQSEHPLFQLVQR